MSLHCLIELGTVQVMSVSNGCVLIQPWKNPNESFVDINLLSAKEDVSKQLLVANIRLSILTLYQYVHSKKVT